MDGCCTPSDHDAQEGSTTASQASSVLLSNSGGEATPHPPHNLPEGLRIQNTFISGFLGESLDTRTVRSLPHGMFKRCLLDEMAACEGTRVQSEAKPCSNEASAVASEVVRVDSSAAEPEVLAPGTEVMIQGLTRLPEFNGLMGTVQCLDESVGRYDILLVEPVGSTGQRWAKVKRDNLCVAAEPLPPRHAPSLLPEAECVVDTPPLQLPSVLPAVDYTQFAHLDLGTHYNLDCPFQPFCPPEGLWYGIDGCPTWQAAPVLLST